MKTKRKNEPGPGVTAADMVASFKSTGQRISLRDAERLLRQETRLKAAKLGDYPAGQNVLPLAPKAGRP